MTLDELNAIPNGTRLRVTVEGTKNHHDIIDSRGATIIAWVSDSIRDGASVEIVSPPVDPDVLAVRELLADFDPPIPWGRKAILSGKCDKWHDFKLALGAYRAGKEAAR